MRNGRRRGGTAHAFARKTFMSSAPSPDRFAANKTFKSMTLFLFSSLLASVCCRRSGRARSTLPAINVPNGHKSVSNHGEPSIGCAARRSEVSPIQSHVSDFYLLWVWSKLVGDAPRSALRTPDRKTIFQFRATPHSESGSGEERSTAEREKSKRKSSDAVELH